MNARWQSTTTALAASFLVILAALVLLGAALPPAPHAPERAMSVTSAAAPAVMAPAGLAPDPDWRPREPLDGAELRLALRRLRVLGSVLYIGAHPDDENTAFLAYLTQGRLARTAYLSLTRGDGGQNLIGDEIGEPLGVIRTQELLAARHVDGAEQYFSRALDFGFTKNPEETFAFWGRDSILSDVVWVVRAYRPDVIVTRFPTDGRGGHGHHTASALLAEAAFAAAADSTRFPEQLRYVRPWRARRLLWNVFGSDTTKAPGHPPILTVDLGGYQPMLGRSFTEIAGQSRSMHKSQGFGAAERRGSIPNFFEPRLGDPARRDLFDGVDLGWSRVKGGASVDRALGEAETSFDPAHPEAVLPALLRAHAALAGLGGDPWVEIKRRDLEEAIRSCAGLWIEATASKPEGAPGGTVRIATSALMRNAAGLTLEKVEFPLGAAVNDAPRALVGNVAVVDTAVVTLPADRPYSQPYWLVLPHDKGRFAVSDPGRIGHAMNPPALVAHLTFRVGSERIRYDAPVVYRWTDPVAGERYRSFALVPPATFAFDRKFYVFPGKGAERVVRLVVESSDTPIAGKVHLETPREFRVEPSSQDVKLAGAGAQARVEFRVTSSGAAGSSSGVFRAVLETPDRAYSYGHLTLDHPHIPLQDLFPPAEARYVATEIHRRGESIAYVMGPGDEGPAALEQMGWKVTLLSDADLDWGDLSRFHTIVTGVRAWNTRAPLRRPGRSRLLDYADAGGTLLVQYNTAEDGLGERIGPKPFTISRDRVTVEEAPVTFNPRDPLLAAPNRIGAADFDGWVQERGLYFASRYDTTAYRSVLSCHDPDEPPRNGGLIALPTAKGMFLYTGYSFFRQLPACVPGAYRLFANLVSAEGSAPHGAKTSGAAASSKAAPSHGASSR
jgi:LmbE family N-acetylglucosaminyl deacetylase